MSYRFATDPKRRMYVKGYGFLSFGRNLASSQAARKVRDSMLKQGKEAVVKAGKRAITKGAEATGDFVGQKVADSITKVGSKPSKTSKASKTTNLPSNPAPPVPEVKTVDNMVTQVRNMTPQQRAQILNELSLL